jgi:hypothetical protein
MEQPCGRPITYEIPTVAIPRQLGEACDGITKLQLILCVRTSHFRNAERGHKGFAPITATTLPVRPSPYLTVSLGDDDQRFRFNVIDPIPPLPLWLARKMFTEKTRKHGAQLPECDIRFRALANRRSPEAGFARLG